jgi:uncharacterized protein
MSSVEPTKRAWGESNYKVADVHPEHLQRRSSRSGRASRRRRKKIRAIQQAVVVVGSIGHREVSIVLQDDQTPSGLPRDRNSVWPAVNECRTLHKWSAENDRALAKQLGYVPGNVINIATRVYAVPCLKGGRQDEEQEPVVVQLYPIVLREECSGRKSDGRRFKSRKRQRQSDDKSDGTEDKLDHDADKSLIEPFPTIYWITHPTLRVLISKLELEGFGARLEKRLSNEPEAMASMKRAHTAYGVERLQLLTDSDRSLMRERKWDAAFAETRGVAGIRNHAAIKCLHAHVAHALSGGSGSSDNVVGKWALEAVHAIL